MPAAGPGGALRTLCGQLRPCGELRARVVQGRSPVGFARCHVPARLLLRGIAACARRAWRDAVLEVLDDAKTVELTAGRRRDDLGECVSCECQKFDMSTCTHRKMVCYNDAVNREVQCKGGKPG